MIIFTDNVNIINYLDNVIVFNLSSAYDRFIDITNLIIKMGRYMSEYGVPVHKAVDTTQFDITLMNLIFSDTEMYNSFMNLVSASYNGFNVVVMVIRDSYRDSIMESIIKVIQYKYGYNCWIVEDIEDLECLKDVSIDKQGAYNMGADINTFNELCVNGVCTCYYTNRLLI